MGSFDEHTGHGSNKSEAERYAAMNMCFFLIKQGQMALREIKKDVTNDTVSLIIVKINFFT